MKIIITLSGNSERFTSKGYPIKSLIDIGGKKVIEYVLEMFPDIKDEDFIFAVRSDDLSSSPIESEILKLKNSKIYPVPKNSLGPVYSISTFMDNLPDDEEIIVSYCDLTQLWDFHDFLNFCRDTDSDGCLVTHVGFLPHKLYNKSFAFLSTGKNSKVSYVHEKKPMELVRPDEPASNGIYYFKSGKLLKTYFKKLMDGKHAVNGEYYVTVPYNLMIEDKLNVTYYNANQYVCLGTPVDVECFKCWKYIIEHNNLDKQSVSYIYDFWNDYFNRIKNIT
jgi:NDP-sugar pyrophosphorylase family protein